MGVLDHFETLVRDETPVGRGNRGKVEEEEGHGVDLAEEEGGEAGIGGGVGGRISVTPFGGKRRIEDVDGEGDTAVVEVVGEDGVEERGGENGEGGVRGFDRFAREIMITGDRKT